MIATLYDVHGNLPALEAVLAEIPEEATIVVGGDVCAGGEQPAETLHLEHRRTPYEGAPPPRQSRDDAVALFTERGL